MTAEVASPELATLYEISRVVNSTLDLDDILQEVTRITQDRMAVDACCIYLIENRLLVLRATSGLEGDPSERSTLRLGEGLPGWAAEHGQPVAATRAREDPRSRPAAGFDGARDYVSMLAVPLVSRGTTIGVIAVRTRAERRFSDVDIQELSAIACQISGAIRNTQVHLKAIRSLHELITLNEAGKIINSTLDLDELLSRVCEICTNILCADGCLLRLRHPRHGHLDLVAFHRRRSGDDEAIVHAERDVAERVVEEGFPKLRTYGGEDPETWPNELAGLSLITVPITVKGEPCGTVSVYTCGRAEGPFTVGDRRLLVTLASHAGIAIDNARLFEQQAEAKRKLRETQQQLIETEKLAALGQMAAGVAHELRNPLVSIGGFSRRILKSLDSREAVEEYATVIVNEVKRLESLVRDILTFASPTTTQLEPVDLLEVLNAVNGLLGLGSHSRHALECHVPADLRFVLGDRNLLLRVFLNLAQNGVDAMPGGGAIRIRAVHSLEAADKVVVDVADNGNGIAADLLDKVFDPFFTTKAEGTGLGLAIVKSALDAIKASICVKSRPNEETIFSVCLPLAQSREESDGTVSAAPPSASAVSQGGAAVQ